MASSARFLAGTQAAIYRRATVSAGQRRFNLYTPSTVVVSGVIPQRIEGASPMYKRNVAAKVPFKAVDASNTGATLLTMAEVDYRNYLVGRALEFEKKLNERIDYEQLAATLGV